MKTFKYPHEPELDILRGFAALLVLVSHVINFSDQISFGFNFKRSLINYAPSGHFMVMIFFMLSGYVMALRYSQEENFSFKKFLRTRLIRLYPIYLAVTVFVFFFLESNIQTALSTVFFMQLVLTPCFGSNTAMWSLNHEMLYYLLFGLAKRMNVNMIYLFIIVFFLAIASVTVFPIHALFEAYCTGFFFWLVGYFTFVFCGKNESELSGNKMLSILFLMLGVDFVNFTGLLHTKLTFLTHVEGQYLQDKILFLDMFFLPVAFFVLLIVSNRGTSLVKYLYFFVYGLVLLRLGVLLQKGVLLNSEFLIPLFCCLASLFFYHTRLPVRIKFNWLVYLGGISYAIYLVHMPVYIMVGKMPFLQGTAIGYFVKLLFVISATIGVSCLLELRMQPRIKSYFNSIKKE